MSGRNSLRISVLIVKIRLAVVVAACVAIANDATITGNTLQHMADLALRLDGPDAATSVTGNSFLSNSGPGGHIGVGVFNGNLDDSTIIGANTLDASGGRIGILRFQNRRQNLPITEFS